MDMITYICPNFNKAMLVKCMEQINRQYDLSYPLSVFVLILCTYIIINICITNMLYASS